MKTNLIRILLQVFILIFFPACGIETYYYLSQVPEGIDPISNTEITMVLPALSESHASGYRIYYRIYISGEETNVQQPFLVSGLMSRMNPTLNSDYTNLRPYTDNTNLTTIPGTTTFRNFYELELEGEDIKTLIANGGTFRFMFEPSVGLRPYLRINPNTSNEYERVLLRTNKTLTDDFTNEPNQYFFFTTELDEKTDHTFGVNLDVVRNSSGTGYAYVSMYVLAIGSNPTNFSTIYSKATLIGIFKLPNAY